jgi:hypothetical protein
LRNESRTRPSSSSEIVPGIELWVTYQPAGRTTSLSGAAEAPPPDELVSIETVAARIGVGLLDAEPSRLSLFHRGVGDDDDFGLGGHVLDVEPRFLDVFSAQGLGLQLFPRIEKARRRFADLAPGPHDVEVEIGARLAGVPGRLAAHHFELQRGAGGEVGDGFVAGLASFPDRIEEVTGPGRDRGHVVEDAKARRLGGEELVERVLVVSFGLSGGGGGPRNP